MAKAKRSAHADLDELRQHTATERVKQRDLAGQLDAAMHEVESASRAVTEAYAAEDAKLVNQRREGLQAAEAKVLDLQHRVDAAGIRIERAQREADTFAAEHARDLLDEREGEAREVAASLTRAAAEVVRLHRAYLTMRTEIDGLVAATPGASPRADGPEPSHPWERQLRDLERVVRDVPELPAPLPRWAGLTNRQQENEANLTERERRSGEATEAAFATSGQWITVR